MCVNSDLLNESISESSVSSSENILDLSPVCLAFMFVNTIGDYINYKSLFLKLYINLI